MYLRVLRAAVFAAAFLTSSQLFAAAPTATTSAATSLTTSSAILNGAGDPNGEGATGWFRISSTNPGTCDDVFGTRVPAANGTDLGTGTTSVPYSIAATGLTSGVTYYFCAIAANSSGNAFGAILSFTTPAPPTVTTSAASSVTNASAYLNGSANPNGSATTGWFRYSLADPGTCNDTFGSRAPVTGGSSLGSGSAAQNYSQLVTGLSAATTYYYCAIAASPGGTAFGAVLSFTTASAPATTTSAATLVTSSSATLNGSADPNGNSAFGYFRYSTSHPGFCNDSFGTRSPSSSFSDSALGSGTTDVAFSRGLSGLTPATTYYYCAVGRNSYGVTFGSVLAFTTQASAPWVTTNGASLLTGTTAQLNGSANPGGAATTGWFRYATASPGACNDSFGTRAPVAGGSSLGAGTSSTSYSQGITGLSAGTTYYYCAIVQNVVGTALGSVQSFTTPLPPTVTTSPASSVTNTSAYLNGSANPQGSTTTGWLRYSATDPGTCDDTFGSRAPASGGSSLGAGYSVQSYSQQVTGLSAGTTYYYCAIASSLEGTAFGAVLSFTTPTEPATTTSAATLVGSTLATLNGWANPNLDSAFGYFRYSTTDPGGCNDLFGSRTPSSSSSDSFLGSGAADVAFSRGLSGLTPATTYYYCALGRNGYGTSFGSMLSFTTQASAPVVTTNSATLLTGSTAQLNGTANPGGAPTAAWFRYATASPGACNDSFGTRAPASGGSSLGAGNTTVGYAQGISGLSPATTYYYCAIAQNAAGTTFGAVLSFTTPLPPTVTTSAASSVTNASAYLNGSANPNGSATTGWFRYSLVDPGTCDDTFGSRSPVTGGSSLGSGSSVQLYTQPITGLSAGTTYYYCAIASSLEGTAFGAVLSFTTASAPATTTSAATLVTSSSATLNGSANPNGNSAFGYFRYSTSHPGGCNDLFGTRAPSSSFSDAALGSGATEVAFSRNLSGLTPGTTYYYCALGRNGYGTTFGSVLSFTTQASAPWVTTNSATGRTGSTAQLNGSANPGGAATTGWFRYATANPGTCNDTFGTRAPAAGGSSLGAGTTTTSYSQGITGLSAGTTYYYCAIAQNVAGTALGSVLSFTTPLPPTVTTSPASSLTNTSAYLNGSANPQGSTTTGWFRYSLADPGTCDDTFGSRAPVTGGTSLGAGTSVQLHSQQVTGLSAGTTYYYCAIASSMEGTAFGAVLSFTTPTEPATTTSAATLVTSSSAQLNASANPGGAASTGWFRYGTTNPVVCSDAFGTRTPSSSSSDPSLGAGVTEVAFSRAIAGLIPGTTYYFCAIASNAYGTAFGPVLSFTTLATQPAVTTLAATNATISTVTLNASGIPNGANTTGWFRYAAASPGACNDTFGARAPATGGSSLGAGVASVGFAQDVTGLSPGTTYYYCAIAQNAEGLSFGAVLSFTTLTPPAVSTLAATPVTATTATLTAAVNPNGFETTGWFRYGTTNPGACDTAFGTATGTSSLGSGATLVALVQPLTGLSPATTYYYCAIASSSIGTTQGAVLAFTTQPAPPSVITVAESDLTHDSATLNAMVNPNGGDSTGWFRYSTTNPGSCDDAFGTRAPASGGVSLGFDSSPVGFSVPLSSLNPGTTYFFCAVASSDIGTSVGTVLSFTTTAAPSVTTAEATLVTSTSAMLNGSAAPNLAEATGWFRYSETDPGACDDAFGTRAPASGGSALGAGSSPVEYAQALAGLAPGTTYFYCAVAANAAGTRFGSVQSFTTTAAPAVTSEEATSVASSTATLNGSANPNQVDATGWFRYDTTDPGSCNDSFGARAPASGGSSLGAGASAVAYGQALTGLTPGTTYHFCAIAGNAVGTRFGAVQSFTTTAAPSVTSLAASAVASTTATLNGSANPNRVDAAGWFRYDTTDPGSCNDAFGTRAPVSGATSLGAGSSTVAYSQALASLTPGTTYFYCAIAENAVGTRFGAVLSFTTTAAPGVTTSAATGLTFTGATLNGSANPQRDAASGWFRYGTIDPGTCDDSFGTRAPASGGASLGAGGSAVAYSEALTGLAPGMTYFFCAGSDNAVGTSFGTVRSFTTWAAPPAVVTRDATNPTSASAELNGSANPNAAATTGWFRYGTIDPGTCDDAFGTRAPATGGTSVGAGTSPVDYLEAVTGLLPGTTYYFCALASNGSGTSFGEVRSMTTLADPPSVTTSPPTLVKADSAVLNGAATPNGDATTGWFRYDTSDPGTCDDSFGVRAPATGGADLGGGVVSVASAEPISGLTPGTTYYFCFIAANSQGTRFGQVASFLPTAVAPTVTTEAAVEVLGTGATIAGTANPNEGQTTGWFRYGDADPGTCDDSFGSRAPASGGAALGAGTTPGAYTQALAGLEPRRTYYYCAAASNWGGATFGGIHSFTTVAVPPVVKTVAAGVRGGGAVTLNGAANPNASDTTAWFRFDTVDPGGCNDTFGTRTPAADGTALGEGRDEAPFSESVTGLSPGTYYFCAAGSNEAGIAYGEVMTFDVSEERTHEAAMSGGGCGCRAGSGGGAGSWMAALAASLWLAFRRQRRAV